jgi:hypothetical protein
VTRKRKTNARQKNSKQTTTGSRQPAWLFVAIGLALVLIVGGAAALLITGSTRPTTGTPKLVIDQTVIDEGYQTNNTPVRTAFNIRNEGDGPLRVLGEPQVELVEGC